MGLLYGNRKSPFYVNWPTHENQTHSRSASRHANHPMRMGPHGAAAKELLLYRTERWVDVLQYANRGRSVAARLREPLGKAIDRRLDLCHRSAGIQPWAKAEMGAQGGESPSPGNMSR